MPRGGRREGAGGKYKWKHGKTKTIRVPEVLVENILEIVRFLDDGGNIDLVTTSKNDNVTKSKIIDLSGILIVNFNGQPSVRILDLLRLGYDIKPNQIVNHPSVRAGMVNVKRVQGLQAEIESLISSLE